VARPATILYTTIAALALAVLFVVLSPYEYTATTQILIDPSDLRAVGTDTTQASQLSDDALMQVESQVSVQTSDSVLRRVVLPVGFAPQRIRPASRRV